MDSLQTLLQYLMTGVNFLLIITLLVFVHELGHYSFARWCGMHVDSFAVMVGGIRKTDLNEGLPKPLWPSRFVGMLYGGTVLAVILAALEQFTPVYLVGLFALAFLFPIWIGLRLATLHRMPPILGIKPLLFSYLAAIIMILLTHRGPALPRIADVLVLMFSASLIGLLLIYYAPLGHRPEDAPMGHGTVHDGEKPIPVRYRPVWHWKNKLGTEFSLLALPLGGFAAMRGMHPKEDGSEVSIEGGFYSKPPLARLAVLFAGPLFSVLLGIVILTGHYTVNGTQDLSNKPVIGGVTADGPAGLAGLRANDEIVAVDGVPVSSFFDVVAKVRTSEGRTLTFDVSRDGTTMQVKLAPKLDDQVSPVLGPDMQPTPELKRQYKMMASPKLEYVRMSLGEAFDRAIRKPVDMMRGLVNVFSDLTTANQKISGPAGMASITHGASQSGLPSLLELAGLLSISLGIMNLLPVPPLDGGQMVVAFIELLRGGKRLSLQVQNMTSMVGMFLVAALMLFAISTDAGRILNR